MIRAFFAVLQDLWDFVFGNEPEQLSASAQNPTPLQPMGANVEPVSSNGVKSAAIDIDISGLRPAFVSVESAQCFTAPKIQFDSVLTSFTYGERVGVRRLLDGFAEVVYADTTGWVPVEQLSDDENLVFPHLVPGTVYVASDIETQKLRRCIDDESLGGELGLPLQSLEHVLYELNRRKVAVRWPLVRPRSPGSLHSIMRGHRSVAIGVDPRTASVLEVASGPEDGFFGVVESVHPDQSMTLASVGREVEGEFRRETFQRDEWKEWRPTFISFT